MWPLNCMHFNIYPGVRILYRIGLIPMFKWVNVEMRQVRDIRGAYIFEVMLDKERFRHVNCYPLAFSDVEVHATDENCSPTNAIIRRLYMKFDKGFFIYFKILYKRVHFSTAWFHGNNALEFLYFWFKKYLS